MLNTVGFIVGVLSLLLAIVLFWVQKRDQAQFEGTTQASLQTLAQVGRATHDRLGELAQAAAESTAGSDEEAVVPVEEIPKAEEIVPGVRRYMRDDIPLKVLGDLAQGFREGAEDNSGWLLGEVMFALHKDAGPGNFPWFVVLRDRDKTDRIFMWKVTRGGAGRTGPTVVPWDYEPQPA